jgi:5,10-methylenetetrahydromethanopterin reductase
MTNAAATAMLTELAPGRVAVAFGTGFTGRRAMGYRHPVVVHDRIIDAYRGLLRARPSSGKAPGCRCSTPAPVHPPVPSTCLC